jgi:hypothetical protein
MFKQCSLCGKVWSAREEFLSDEDIELVGYQVNFKQLTSGYFLFNHSCKTTLAIKAIEFADLYDGEVFDSRKTGTEECPGYCLHISNLKPCPAECECAYIREIIQIVKNIRGIA